MLKKIVAKIKGKSISEIWHSVKYNIALMINKMAFYIFKLFPLCETRIILESEGDLCDNAYALYNYIKENGYLNKYVVIWLVDHPEKYVSTEHTKYVKKYPLKAELKRAFYLATSKYYIYDHNNMLWDLKKRKQQKVVYLCHGFAGYKAPKRSSAVRKVLTTFEEIYVTGRIPKELIAIYFDCDLEMVYDFGFPRLDWWFSDLNVTRKIFNEKYYFDKFDKVFLWMPTFRKCDNEYLSENYLNYSTGLPMLNSVADMMAFNDYLKENNSLVVLKLHHLQSEMPAFNIELSNLLVIRDTDLQSMGLQLYQFIGITDALITDYSSISADYYALDKPIIYTLDDYEEYNASRGVFPENALELMRGYQVYNLAELKESISEIANGFDKHSASRREILPDFHTYNDGNTSKRILDHLNITI